MSNGLSRLDPLIAARYYHDLRNGFSATAYGDLGGAGLGAHFDWHLIGTLGCAAGSWTDLHTGFRSVNFSCGALAANFAINMYGPITFATFHF